jgi:hypothetical protein
MTGEILGPLGQEIREVEEQAKLIANRKKELEDKKQLCEEIKIDVMIELDNKYHFERINQSIDKFNEIVPLLVSYINNPNSKLKVSLVKKLTEWGKCFREG